MQQPSRPYFIITQQQEQQNAHQQGQTFALAGGVPNLNLTLNPALTNYPELSLLGQFTNLLPHYGVGGDQQGGSNGVDLSSKLHPALEELAKAGQRASSNSGGRPGSADEGKNASAYASRHQAAEQRRRTRINERLDMLRKLIPHTERANTASFLEEVIKYVEGMKRRVAELEQALQLATKSMGAGGRMERLSTAADAEHQHLQQLHQHVQQQQTNNLVLNAAMQLSLAGGNPAAAFGNGGGGGGNDELLPGLLAAGGIPNLRPQPQQHALFHAAAAAKQQYDEQYNGAGGGGGSKDSPAARPSNLSLSMMGLPAAAPNGGQGSAQGGGQQQQWTAGAAGGAAQAAGPSKAAAAVAAPPNSGGSPVSSEESGVPIKKRKVLVL